VRTGGRKTQRTSRPSRYGKWRALALGSVYLLFGIHIAHWKLAGSTLAPLELNEVMYTLEAGVVTAGFLLMATLAIATAIFGRFFCSWACHILALEDLCAWILRKLRIRVQPVRSRVLALVPVIALFYMFVWPQLLRMAAGRPMPRWRILTDADGWASFVTDDFWRNLPDPWIAGLTFAICGFAVVYVLGSRSFCLHACPYGALFAAVDHFAPGRIKLTGDCVQCATCTAVCTSHVRVHEEIARFGKVVDTHCMKDLDCVSSCPEQALSFGFTRPAPLASFRASGRSRMKPAFTLGEDVVMALVFLATVLVFRGLYSALPFLMSLGLAGIVAYLAVVVLRLTERPDLRLIRFRLKRAGRLTGAGRLFLAGAALFALFALHSAYIRFHEHRGQQAFTEVRRAQQAGEPLSPVELGDALHHLTLAYERGLVRPLERDHQLASLHLKGGSATDAEPYLRRILSEEPDDMDSRLALAQILAMSGQPAESARFLEGAVERHPDSPFLRYNLAVMLAEAGNDPAAIDAYEAALELAPDDLDVLNNLGFLLIKHGRAPEAEPLLLRAVELRPDFAHARFNLGGVYEMLGDLERAGVQFREAARLDERYAEFLGSAYETE
jgi:tetratricopeptide (TPR) repeat protein/ferredoxin